MQLWECDIILDLLLFLRDTPKGLDPLLHERQDRPGFQDCIPECSVHHLVQEPGFLLEQFVCICG
jgi:hypothetical protein